MFYVEGMPDVNFAHHCWTPISEEYPHLYRCPNIEQGIKECQERGKQVLLSLGGAIGNYGFENDDQAKEFAKTFWNLILGGDSDLRPFGTYDSLSYSFWNEIVSSFFLYFPLKKESRACV